MLKHKKTVVFRIITTEKDTITINGIIRFSDIRLFEYESGAKVIRFPEKVIHKNGDFEFKRIIDFQKSWEEIISIDIWDAS